MHLLLHQDAERLRVMADVLPTVEEQLATFPEVEACWQPSDFLPDFAGPTWREELDELRAEAERLEDDMLVVLVGNVVTEEALPSYQTALNRFGGMTDATGTERHAWACWSRAWTAEEKRHGDVTRAYLLLGGRVAMREVERTIQHLLRNGFDTGADGDPYKGLAYASIQEHATKTSWNQLGRVVRRAGADRLRRMCGLVAADEARHERAYRGVLLGVLERDPDGALEALRHVVGHVAMPARLMAGDGDVSLFRRFSAVGTHLGIYSLHDYADNLEGFFAEARVGHLTGLGPDGARLQDELCEMPARYRRQADAEAKRRHRPTPFAWIHDRRA